MAPLIAYPRRRLEDLDDDEAAIASEPAYEGPYPSRLQPSFWRSQQQRFVPYEVFSSGLLGLDLVLGTAGFARGSLVLIQGEEAPREELNLKLLSPAGQKGRSWALISDESVLRLDLEPYGLSEDQQVDPAGSRWSDASTLHRALSAIEQGAQTVVVDVLQSEGDDEEVLQQVQKLEGLARAQRAVVIFNLAGAPKGYTDLIEPAADTVLRVTSQPEGADLGDEGPWLGMSMYRSPGQTKDRTPKTCHLHIERHLVPSALQQVQVHLRGLWFSDGLDQQCQELLTIARRLGLREGKKGFWLLGYHLGISKEDAVITLSENLDLFENLKPQVLQSALYRILEPSFWPCSG